MGQFSYCRPMWRLCLAALFCATVTDASAQGVDIGKLKDQLLVLFNQQRAAAGAPPLQRVSTLEKAAQTYSETMMQATDGGPVYLSHVGPDGSTLEGRVSLAGYVWSSLGEILAAGQKTPEQAVSDWLSSPLHRSVMLNPGYRDVGIGIAVGPGTWSNGRVDPQVIWWAADFGTGPGSDQSPDDGGVPAQPLPPPSITGYALLDGSTASGASFGSLLLIQGQNLGFAGSVSFHGQPTSAVTWSPTSIMTFVPLQPIYPDVGPVTVTVDGGTANGPDFTTVRPGDLVPVSSPGSRPPATNPGSTPSPTPAPVQPTGPTIVELEGSDLKPLTTVRQGMLFTISGHDFGPNLSRLGRVVFILPSGAQLSGAVWDWSDRSITAFAPFFRGSMQVVVQVDASGSTVSTNRVPLTVQ
jgi:uncharacterized protein YkwD